MGARDRKADTAAVQVIEPIKLMINKKRLIL